MYLEFYHEQSYSHPLYSTNVQTELNPYSIVARFNLVFINPVEK
jgi:carboxypeptidase C (cathepsin A)